ncbi:hypothetical protein KKH36_04045 [Patescibacteria group bacterium]|nr:hypothetical protein [Patescibacteria group bacterium]
MNNKIAAISGVIMFFLIIALTLIFVLWITPDEKDSKKSTTQIKKTEKWVYCWSDPTDKRPPRCGFVKTLKTEDEKVIKFVVHWPKTGVKTTYERLSIEKIGKYVQPGETGTWSLRKGPLKNEFTGWEEDERGVRMSSSLKILLK